MADRVLSRCRRTRSTGLALLLLSGLQALDSSAEAHRHHPPGDPIEKHDQVDSFRQLEELLPTPNASRSASGAPGHAYWQQQADYVIKVEIDDTTQRLIGAETLTYTNNSPDTLRYLWFQLDQNRFRHDAAGYLIESAPSFKSYSFESFQGLVAREGFDGGLTLSSVTDGAGVALDHAVVKTMMRVDLSNPLAPGQTTAIAIDWSYPIVEQELIGGRGGYEYFEKDDNYLYEIAQWFPRVAAYTDVNGWQHKQFLGRGEFTLEFGNYDVSITVPADHIVAATGVLQNPDQVLTPAQRDRLREAEHASEPMFIVTPEEATANETSRSPDTHTWVFHATNVRDFAFASSRKFIWDAVRQDIEGEPVWAMSYYPKEGEPLWSKYSTHAIVHTLEVYSKFTFTYPYPVAISVNGPVGGMEYPMICFNGPRPEEDGTYSRRTKYGLISVIIHEVGHNWFPMIVNSDERQWTWMDEGLNTYLQFLAEQEWEDEYPSRRGEPKKIISYMTSENQVPIMTNSESLLQFGSNGYAKPATALNILRESVLGRELFDFAFKEYTRRWMFKRPMPSDLFRSLEDASGIDLDWFWRGWFYSTTHTDLAIANLTRYRISPSDPEGRSAVRKAERDGGPETLSEQRNRDLPKRTDRFPDLLDFYNTFDELNVSDDEREAFTELMERLTDDRKEIPTDTDFNFYVMDLENIGGLVMPALLHIVYEDGTEETVDIPAEIWRRDNEHASKLLLTRKIIVSLELDPHLATADADVENNRYPRRPETKHFELKKGKKSWNPMQELQKEDDKDQ